MPLGYFTKLYESTSTRMWINNPSASECDKAITAGAINCTLNPQYCQKLLVSDPKFVRTTIDSLLENGIVDHEQVVTRLQEVAARRIMDKFLPLFENSAGSSGYVTVQDDPRRDSCTDAVIDAARRNRRLGRNYMAKIPVIDGGIQAIEQCVIENIPVCATEVFTISQTVDICEIYAEAARRSGNRPPFFVTHITGIFDEYIRKYAERKKIDINPDILSQAGCAIARKEYEVIKNKKYNTIMLGGGVRELHHFTEMVGGDVHITMNLNDIDAILQKGIEVIPRIAAETPQAVVDELCDKLLVFRQAYLDQGLQRKDYAEYGPVQLFRNNFMKGWFTLLSEVADRRTVLAI